MTITTLLIIIASAIVGGAVVWYLQRQRSLHLRQRFGPEYERTRTQIGDPRRAEAVLAEREKRVEKFHIHPLAAEEATRFGEVWRHVQALFVDDPKGAIREADELVNEVMSAKGYPMTDFAQRQADISVDHPVVVEHYRAARAIAERNQSGSADTEELRQAIIHYRALFEELLERKPSEQSVVHAKG